ncbi:hypothetical protein D8Y22_06940 [Salinadaptatus halalkaliphilus]|uniref:Uncharacterized protein n=1 Tax=Salinadaptatus halalkaliphilus TaxID=2419781 RepID=A0A4S3TQL8_9EURY|nr:hypothetical protein [Salinadaptatus halalkaliphilus]THE65545.1 hypothetical protein D8Y22_06940 [Salinadaptatus halalkaliphilus]
MTDDDPISRRTSLKGIAATGALLGGAGLGINSASAGEKKHHGDKHDGKHKKGKHGDDKDGTNGDGIPGVAGIDFDACHTMAVHFDGSYADPTADGSVAIPITTKDGFMTLPTVGDVDDAITIPTAGANTFLQIPIGEVTDDYVEILVQNDTEIVDSSRYVRVPLGKLEDGSITLPAEGPYDGYYKLPLIGGGHIPLPAGGKEKDALVIALENGYATFPVHDDDGGALVTPVVQVGDAPLANLRIRTYNGRKGRIENVQRTITADDLTPSGRYGSDVYGSQYTWTFTVFQFYDHVYNTGDKILSVSIGEATVQNPNDCATEYQVGYDSAGYLDLEKLSLSPVCVDSETNMARFRVRNANEKPVAAAYAVEGTDRAGSVFVEPESATYIHVAAPDGDATVSLIADGKVIATRDSRTDVECLPRGQIPFNAECVERLEGAAKFYIHNGTDTDLTFFYHVAETGELSAVTVPDDMTSSETFWVEAPDGEVTTTIYYEDEAIASATSDPSVDC